jgi:hypothetical protein
MIALDLQITDPPAVHPVVPAVVAGGTEVDAGSGRGDRQWPLRAVGAAVRPRVFQCGSETTPQFDVERDRRVSVASRLTWLTRAPNLPTWTINAIRA